MFSIEFLLIPQINELVEKEEDFAKKAKILIDLLSFEENFPDYRDEIAFLWREKTGERFDSFFSFDKGDVELIIEYAVKVKNIVKVKNLINDLCCATSNVDGYDYDSVIYQAELEIKPIIDDNDISDFQFSLDNEKVNKQTELRKKMSFDKKMEQMRKVREKMNKK